MGIRIATGISRLEGFEAYADAARDAAAGLGGLRCDLCVVFAAGTPIAAADTGLAAIHDALAPAALIGCGAGGVVGEGRELESGPGVAVWAGSFPDGRIETHHLTAPISDDEPAETPDWAGDGWESVILLADPYTFAVERALETLNDGWPGRPVLGGLVSATVNGSGVLFKDAEVLTEGAVAATLDGVPMVPCVSQGATPVGPEMAITAAEGNVITELASRPALDRLGAAIASLEPRERELAAQGVMLGIVIDENKPDFERGDFLIRPIIGADEQSRAIAIGEPVRIGQTVRLHVRDGASADEDLRAALAAESQAIGSDGAAGALLFTCNGRGSHMFPVPDHDAALLSDALGVEASGFFCAGEIGPVGGRNFLHGFTATMAVFPRD